MPASVTTFRQNLQVALKAAISTDEHAVEFVGGPIDVGQDSDIGCVWMVSKKPFVRDGNMEVITYGVRLFRTWLQPQGFEEIHRNVVRLEDDVELLQTALKAILTTTVGHDFFELGDVEPDYEHQFVQVELTAYQRNKGAAGG